MSTFKKDNKMLIFTLRETSNIDSEQEEENLNKLSILIHETSEAVEKRIGKFEQMHVEPVAGLSITFSNDDLYISVMREVKCAIV